ncbi:MAG: NAD(P)-dependent oxidoreductase [Clostridia bacterium]|nr:NAD(P)-dependent oxidoreductase [Clostridia bacterium]
MRKTLVGYTGFVGSNILESYKFDHLYDSSNITEGFSTEHDLLVYSGVPAQKTLANSNPEVDLKIIENAKNNIKKLNPKEIVLISTTDVYPNPELVDEDYVIDTTKLQPYGLHRYYLEEWVKENIDNHLIVHLPALYGKNLKKNFIFDIMTIIPFMLKSEKIEDLKKKLPNIYDYYTLSDNGFYKLNSLSNSDREVLKEFFLNNDFNALNFTDSRNNYQFYNLANLWKHINIARENNIRCLNLATEPINAGELYKYIYDKNFINELNGSIVKYNMKTKYDTLFNGNNGYVFDKYYTLNDIKKFIKGE